MVLFLKNVFFALIMRSFRKLEKLENVMKKKCFFFEEKNDFIF